MGWRVVQGDCVERMRELDEASVDAVVCDPPYGLEFMGKEWDAFRQDTPTSSRHRGERAGTHGSKGGDDRWGDGGRSIPSSRTSFGGGGKRPSTQRCVECGKRDQFNQPHEPCGAGTWERVTLDPHSAPPTMLAFQEWSRLWATEALRVLKPGGHLLAFGGTRTYHRLACAVEDAGFEIRDTICWLYGSGFPKSLDVSKAIDKAAGEQREQRIRGVRSGVVGPTFAQDAWSQEYKDSVLSSEPITPEAEQWDGWGTALKPAHEPVVVARKPLSGTVAGNVLVHGTGALNVDGCRISGDEDGSRNRPPSKLGSDTTYAQDEWTRTAVVQRQDTTGLGRWPANVILDPESARLLDEQTGELHSGGVAGSTYEQKRMGAYTPGAHQDSPFFGSAGGASRFFYCAKASRAERNAGLEGFEEQAKPVQVQQSEGRQLAGQAESMPTRNPHPTVKPIDLMRWLVRLVTPPGGTVLDPFTGSGTTGCACALEGFDFIGLEREPEYVQIAEARIAYWSDPVKAERALALMRAEQEVAVAVAEGRPVQLELGEAA